MAIVANTVSENGDVLYIKTDVAAVGLLALTGFVSSTTNEDYPYTYFEKTFRYSLDGITWSSWYDLITENITAIDVNPYATFFIEYRYEKKGALGIENLGFNSITLDATYEAQSCGIYFNNSIFSQYFDCQDIEVLGWYLNVTEKLFNTGVLAQYLPRKNENGSSEDFIIFWKSVAKFFAYYVVCARKFQNFYQNEDLIREYLLQRGLNVTNNDDLVALNTLMGQFTSEISKRGTINIYDKDSEIKGEILRLIFFEEFDEFIFNFHSPENFGWTLNRSSPMYRGLDLDENANKFYEKTEPIDITKYPIKQTIDSPVTIEELEGFNVIKLNSNASEECGIYFDEFNQSKLIAVSENIDYELSFSMKVDGDMSLTVGFLAYDKDFNQITLRQVTNNANNDNFILEHDFINPNNTWIKLRFLFYNKNANNTDYTLIPNFGAGINLKMVENIAYVAPTITTKQGTIYLKDLKFIPSDTPYSRGFLNVKNYISMWSKNRNSKYSLEELEDYIRRFMIPYNSNIKVIEL